MFSSTIQVLETIVDDGSTSEQRCEANNLLNSMQSFEFVFTLHLMKTILGITEELSKALQKNDQDIVNAMTLVKICKERLQMLRDDVWNSFLKEVSSFSEKHNIIIPSVDDIFIARGRS